MKTTVTSALVLLLLAAPARSAFETLVPVVQPVESDGGPEPTVTTYSVYIDDGTSAVTRMLLTVAPNAIVSSSGVPEDRNLASAQGIKFVCTQAGDTLVVEVDLKAAKPSDPDPKYAARGVGIVLWCGLRNARSAWPKVRHVQYKLEGDTYLLHYAGIYDLEKVSPHVTDDTWDLGAFGPDHGQRPTGR
jgi:hypothetical protein